mgnify:FL=1
MKKKWYRKSGIKALFIFLTIVFLVTACVSAGASVWIMHKGVQPLDSRKYVDSESFENSVYSMSHTILEALKEREILDENSNDDLIDLVELKEGKTLSHKNTSGLAYKAEDLINWSQSSWDQSANVLMCRKPDGSNYYMYCNDFADKIITGELKLVFDSDAETSQEYTKDVLSMLSEEEYSYYDSSYSDTGIRRDPVEYVADADGNIAYTNVWNYESREYNDSALAEKYKPDGADSILDIVNDSTKWKGDISKAYQYLYAALEKYSNAADAEKILETYAQSKTNLGYLFVDKKSGKVYSNMKSVTVDNYGKILDKKIRNLPDPYMIIYPEEQNCETGFTGITDQTVNYWQTMIANVGLADSDYVYAVSVDKDFPVSDSIAQEKIYYDKFAPLLIPMIIIAAVALVLALAGLVILTIAAGRNNEDQEVKLNFFDRWYTEIAAGLVVGIWLFGTAIIMQMLGAVDLRMAIFLVGIGLLGLWGSVWFLIGWLSLVRRIKARSLWRDSLLRHILIWIRKIFLKFGDVLVFLSSNTISRIKTIVLFGGFLILQFMLTGAVLDGGGSVVSLLLLFVLDCIVLYYLLRKAWGREQILEGLKKITDGELQYKISTEKLSGEQETMADYINHIGEGLDAAVENSLKNERMKTELITNVSHDIKTPLTSIINYIDLLKRENPEDPKIRGYLEILENKAQRLKVLTEDVVEASKASTGNIALEMTELNFIELVNQVIGEFEEKFEERNLKMVVHFDEEEAMICADGRRLWRVLENVFGNVSKYAMENTRVYVDVKINRPNVQLSLKNISAQPLNISADELTERFIRGDVSRNTEGSGLGLSIAKDLVQLQGGEFKLYLDGDLFKVTIEFEMK